MVAKGRAYYWSGYVGLPFALLIQTVPLPICPMSAAGGRRRTLRRDRRYIHRIDIGRSDANKNEPHQLHLGSLDFDECVQLLDDFLELCV